MKRLHPWLACSTILFMSACTSNSTAPQQTTNYNTTATYSERAETNLAQRPDVINFIDKTHKSTGIDKKWLTNTMNKASIKPTIIDAMNRPAEKMNWGRYRPIFMTENRIKGGVDFYHQYQSALLRAEAEYGVSAAVITAIIGVETSYGANRGNWAVVDALSTLSFEYPRRADFFSNELQKFLNIAYKMNRDPFSFKGSYAGAMGYPQFMPSSYMAYAVDFDGDGIKDLWNNPVDAIGSVANYLAKHGWQRGGQLASQVSVTNPQAVSSYFQRGPVRPPKTNLSTLKQLGVQSSINTSTPVTLMQFEVTPNHYEYWIGFYNFYVITRYNHSNMYALAVSQLANAINERK
ncbi:lytic murein transglycosylase B [Wohlfahrtiimonas larvae]|uniref:Lytic murein transglycosylase B n=1 Tax=Wohlfahrtiimonas larvae TaxID=1157986 RepID=A0ABP9MCS5_9GAMM|nr:lytic murein transglycosylase B [Wohlfahrtiimonas larvae]